MKVESRCRIRNRGAISQPIIRLGCPHQREVCQSCKGETRSFPSDIRGSAWIWFACCALHSLFCCVLRVRCVAVLGGRKRGVILPQKQAPSFGTKFRPAVSAPVFPANKTKLVERLWRHKNTSCVPAPFCARFSGKYDRSIWWVVLGCWDWCRRVKCDLFTSVGSLFVEDRDKHKDGRTFWSRPGGRPR